jgi:hypothetical protein
MGRTRHSVFFYENGVPHSAFPEYRSGSASLYRASGVHTPDAVFQSFRFSIFASSEYNFANFARRNIHSTSELFVSQLAK